MGQCPQKLFNCISSYVGCVLEMEEIRRVNCHASHYLEDLK